MRIGRLLLLTILGLSVLQPALSQHLFEQRPSAERSFEASGVSLDQAVAMAQRRYRARVVKAETVQQGDRRVHKIRLLSAEGKVWTVRVDAKTGAMN